ncbi:hypothetical protein E2C01_035083 [Portunus trituberculatus]|uniref:Uncharacterized protein n=1 Tax=Portunus trituberculatus TaxID=210409 RepID=A0A5B7F287_PORTR|nr:hypothetical protein [Portunus trituberculatus]
MMGRGMIGQGSCDVMWVKETVARIATLGSLVHERLQHCREELCTPWNTSVAAKTVLQREKAWNTVYPPGTQPCPPKVSRSPQISRETKKGQTRQPAIYKNG